MAIPEVSEFQAWNALAYRRLELPVDVRTWLDGHSSDAHEFSEEWSTACLDAIDTEKTKTLQLLEAHSVSVWLTGQREYQRAERLVLVGRKIGGRQTAPRKAATAAERVTAMFDEALGRNRAAQLLRPADLSAHLTDRERFHRAAGEDAGAKLHASEDVRRQLSRIADYLGPAHSWRRSCVQALHEYYYGNSAGANFDASKVSIALSAELAAATNAATKSMNSLIEMLKVAEQLGFTKRPIHYKGLARYAESFVNAAERVSCPVHRRDARTQERLFVFRLFLANRRWARKPKAEAIVELMGLEGFRHQYDLRTVERICTGFAGDFFGGLRPYVPGLPNE
jgi:hypothetical protein